MSLPVEIVSLGRFAQAALAACGEARLIAVFERSGYVETPLGLACVGKIGCGPLNAIVDVFPAGLAVGDALWIDVRRAFLWKPRTAPGWNARSVAGSLGRLRDAAHSLLPGAGFGYLLGEWCAQPPAVAALARWLAEPTGIPSDAGGLIGLGPGLTPAGDDLIGGALCALHAAGRGEIAARLALWALPLARTGTNRISQAHLACAAQGTCGEAVNDAIVALLSGEPPDLARIDAVGHTSGWDALAGAVLALGALLKS